MDSEIRGSNLGQESVNAGSETNTVAVFPGQTPAANFGAHGCAIHRLTPTPSTHRARFGARGGPWSATFGPAERPNEVFWPFSPSSRMHRTFCRSAEGEIYSEPKTEHSPYMLFVSLGSVRGQHHCSHGQRWPPPRMTSSGIRQPFSYFCAHYGHFFQKEWWILVSCDGIMSESLQWSAQMAWFMSVFATVNRWRHQ